MAVLNFTDPKATPSSIPADVLAALAKCEPYALKTLADWQGPMVFNPIIGGWPGATFDNLAKSLALLHELYEKRDQIEATPGIELLLASCWSAASYEAFRLKEAADRPETEGAAVAVDLFRQIQEVAEAEGPATTDDAIKASVARLEIAVGSALFELEGGARDGFVSALTEYLHTLHSAGTPNLNVWRPSALVG